MKIQGRSLLFIIGIRFRYFFFPGAQEKAGAGTQDVADKLSDTFSDLINLTLQNNLHYGIGPHNGSKNTISVIDPFFSVFNKDSNFQLKTLNLCQQNSPPFFFF